MNPLGTTLDPAYVIGWHVGKAAADRAAHEFEVAVTEVWRDAA